MFGFLTRKRANRALIDTIYRALLTHARDPALFTDLKITDNFEGRFETLTLFVVLATRRLKAMPHPAPDLAQDLVDHLFAQFDRALREMGVGDITVPKRMKTMASAFMGRASAYDQALLSDNDGLFADAILRNVYSSDGTLRDMATKLSAIGRTFDRSLSNTTIETIADTIKSTPSTQTLIKA